MFKRFGDGLDRLGRGFGNRHPFAGGETIGLDHDSAWWARFDVLNRRRRVAKCAAFGTWNSEAIHDVVGPRFRAFDAGRGCRGAESRDAAFSELVGQT